ncbi:sigma-70 family RNA polymerase sigma factor [Sphingobium sp. H39-3-25]|uniref:RNA polymerase sigma factor n=1 Tax=Sphingobium arseniciresistens TaxID=3030834 RepID=UPI0023B9738F|nr:sigma-70 family RNA polymerase sigma factor [Sphingobium arseniciresistens]
MASPPLSGLEAIFLVNRPKLLAFFTSRTRDPAEAEEIVQEIHLRLGRTRMGPLSDALGYLYRIGLDLAIDRGRARQHRTGRNATEGEAACDGSDVDATPSQFAQLLAEQRSQRIAGVLASMPAGAARTFRLHKVEGMSHRQIADRMGITRQGVEKNMAVAFRHLAKELQK